MGNMNCGVIRDVVALRAQEIPHCQCGCEEITWSCSVHPEQRLSHVFDHREKVLLLYCDECERLVVKIKVAEVKS